MNTSGKYGDPVPHYTANRRRPLYYLLPRFARGVAPTPKLAVMGHYEAPCGGCDTIPKMDTVFDNVLRLHYRGWDVLYEGLLISAEVKRTLALEEATRTLRERKTSLLVVALTTPLEQCLEGINTRRRIRMGEKFTPVNPRTTEAKYRGVQNSMRRLQEAGVQAVWHERERAYAAVLEALNR